LFDLTLVEALADDIVPEIAEFIGSGARRDFAVVYSRLAGALWLLRNGELVAPEDEPRAIVRSRIMDPGGGWSRHGLTLERPLGDQARAAFSPRDWRIWSLDRSSQGTKAWRLRRIDPGSGKVETSKLLDVLAKYDKVWLASYDDGRVLLVATTKAGGSDKKVKESRRTSSSRCFRRGRLPRIPSFASTACTEGLGA
jgi:hypothetical protein